MFILACILELLIFYMLGYIGYCKYFISHAKEDVGIIVTDSSGRKVCQYSINGETYQKNIISAGNSKVNSKGQLERPIYYLENKPKKIKFETSYLSLIIKVYRNSIPICFSLLFFSLGVHFNVNPLFLTALLIISLLLLILSSIRLTAVFLQSLKKKEHNDF